MQGSVPWDRKWSQDRLHATAPCLTPREADEVLMVTRLDRLAPSTRDLLSTAATITDWQVGLRPLGDAGQTPRRRTGGLC